MEGGARGCQINCSGKLTGGERAKAQKFTEGYVFHSGQKEEFMEEAKEYVSLRRGTIGLKVIIIKPKNLLKPLPDVVTLKNPQVGEVLPLTFSYTGFAPIGPDWDPVLLRHPPKVKKEEPKQEEPKKGEPKKEKPKKGDLKKSLTVL